MTARPITFLLAIIALTPGLRGADEEPAPKTNMKEALRARMMEDAKKKPVAPTSPAKADKPEPPPDPTTAPVEPAKDAAKKNAATQQQPAMVLPKVEVKKGRITVLDQQLAKQDEEIAREKKNLKSSEVDLALNDAKVAKPLSIFGGDSAQFRKRVASERVELMEAEKDLMTAIAQAKTKKEKEELQKQLEELRTMRRELDKTLR